MIHTYYDEDNYLTIFLGIVNKYRFIKAEEEDERINFDGILFLTKSYEGIPSIYYLFKNKHNGNEHVYLKQLPNNWIDDFFSDKNKVTEIISSQWELSINEEEFYLDNKKFEEFILINLFDNDKNISKEFLELHPITC